MKNSSRGKRCESIQAQDKKRIGRQNIATKTPDNDLSPMSLCTFFNQIKLIYSPNQLDLVINST